MALTSPLHHPTWHERAYSPGTPEHMHFLLREEARGTTGQFGHHYWQEFHPYYTRYPMGVVRLFDVMMHEVPMEMRQHSTVDSQGRVWMTVMIDKEIDDGPHES